MWLKLATVSMLLVIQGVTGDDCTFTVSVLNVPGVQCVSAVPCSGTYYASGLAQGVGACPTGSSCALLPLTPIMTCAASGRTDLVYVNADGTLTKDGKSVTLLGAPLSTTNSATDTSSTTKSATDSSTTDSSITDNSSTKNKDKSATSNTSNGRNASPGSDSPTNNSDAKANDNSLSNSMSANKTTSNSSYSDSGSDSSTSLIGSSSDNNEQAFNPGTILSDGPITSNSSRQGGLGLGAIIAIIVACLAVVAIAAGARLLKKGKETQLATPGATGGLEVYNNVGGGGGGMTPKENVLLL